jgi:hypothetical protein
MLVKSENRIRGVNKFAIYGQHQAQREKVAAILTQHITRPLDIVHGDMNRFVVTLCRISAGFLDSEDNLTGAFKHVRDSVGRWLGFKNDNDKRLTWKYQQQECPLKWHLIRITIDDETEGLERETVLGKSPDWLGAISDGCVRVKFADVGAPGRTRGKARSDRVGDTKGTLAQGQLAFRRSFIACPWDLGPDAADDDIVTTELRQFAHVEMPPEQFQARIPAKHVDAMLRKYGSMVRGMGPGVGPRLVFERVDHDDPALGGKCWLYMPVEDE